MTVNDAAQKPSLLLKVSPVGTAVKQQTLLVHDKKPSQVILDELCGCFVASCFLAVKGEFWGGILPCAAAADFCGGFEVGFARDEAGYLEASAVCFAGDRLGKFVAAEAPKGCCFSVRKLN